MAKFNQGTLGIKTTNAAGGESYSLSVKDELISQVLTSFFNEPKYYGDNTHAMFANVRVLVHKEPKFIAALAIYAREVFHLRSVSHMLVAELAREVKGSNYVRQAIARVVKRPDDMKEILAYYISTYGKPIPNSLKKGLAQAFGQFNEHALAKYNGGHRQIKLKDILNLTHPKPTNTAQALLWKRVLEDKLQTPTTWETQISKHGNLPEVWDELIATKQLPYVATLRNLRNIIMSGAKNLDMALDYLQNPGAVAHNKQFPFRFHSASQQLSLINEYVPQKVFDAINNALHLSVKNIPHLPGTTLFISDNSASMYQTTLSEKSQVSCADVANILMASSHLFCEKAIMSVFASEFKIVEKRDVNILDTVRTISATQVGHSSHLYLAIEWLLKTKTVVDRIVVLSDMQVYCINGERNERLLNQYRQTINPAVWVHSIDLQGYGTAPINYQHPRVNGLAGWSDRIIDFIPLVEAGKTTLSKTIADYVQFN